MAVRPMTQARRNAVKKHDAEKVDKITVRLPKGMKDDILETGNSVNTFVIDAVAEKLEKLKKGSNK